MRYDERHRYRQVASMAHRCTLHHLSLQQTAQASSEYSTQHLHCSSTQQEHSLHFQLSGEHTSGEIALCLQNQHLWRWQVSGQDMPVPIIKDTLNCLEKIACQYLLESLAVPINAQPSAKLRTALAQQGYIQRDCGWQKSLHHRQTRYQKQIAALMRELQVPLNYPVKHRLAVQPEPSRLVSIGLDMYQREQRTTPGAARAWQLMKAAALDDQINLQLVSAFRSVEYQAGIIRRKQARGFSTADIYRVSAAPGFSEHHTGCALDLSTPSYAVLEEEFAESPAYAWLAEHAQRFGFVESFPNNNIHELVWEPWHWAWHPEPEAPVCACYAAHTSTNAPV